MAGPLDDIDKRILFELDLDSRIPEMELARRIRRSREVVRYRIAQLKERGIIKGFWTWINVSKLGYTGYKVYLKIGGSRDEQADFFERLKSREDVFWLGVADGAWDVGLTFFAKSNEEFFTAKNDFFAEYADIIIEKKIGVLSDVHAFPLGFLHKDERGDTMLFGRPVENRIDEADRRILGQLFHNARIRLVELARNTGTTIDVVRSRMSRLEKEGVIARYGMAIDHAALGLEFFKTFLYFDELSAENERKLIEYCRQQPNVLRVIRQISPWDIELEVMVPDYQKYNGIMHELRELFPHELRNMESAIISQDYVFPAEKTIFD